VLSHGSTWKPHFFFFLLPTQSANPATNAASAYTDAKYRAAASRVMVTSAYMETDASDIALSEEAGLLGISFNLDIFFLTPLVKSLIGKLYDGRNR
jgi:hypothetical protein